MLPLTSDVCACAQCGSGSGRAPHPQVQLALVRTVRMLKIACSTVDNREQVVAKLDEQLALAVEASARAGVHPVDRARIEAETTGRTGSLDGGGSTRQPGTPDGAETAG